MGSPEIESPSEAARGWTPARVSFAIALALFVASLAFRLVGIGWGLPNEQHHQPYHPDELLNYGVSRQIDLAHGQVAPHFYNYGTAYFIAESVANKVVSAYGGSSAAQSESDYWAEIGRGILTGRVLSALAGAGTVVVLWLILRRLTTLFGALFGAGVIAIAPGFLVHSRFETPDVMATFWLCLSALFALRVLGPSPGSVAADESREPTMLRDAILAGIFAGIGTGTKYTDLLVIVVLWTALALTRRSGWWRSAVAGTVACLAAFILTTPGFLLESQRFWEDFNFELGHTAKGHGLVFIGTPSGFLYHIGNLFVGVGILLTLAGAAGLLYAAWRRHPWAIALLAFGLIYYLAIGRAQVKFLRYTFPLLLPLAAGYGYAMGSARRRGGWGHTGVAFGIIALAGIDFGGLAGSARYSQFMSGTDPRDEAALYLRRFAGQGSVGFVSDPWFYTPPLIPDAGIVNRGRLEPLFQELAAADHPKLVRFVPDGNLDARMDWDVRLLDQSKPDYVVYSSFEADDLERLAGKGGLDPDTQARVDRFRTFMVRLPKSYKPNAAFGTAPPMPAIHDLMYIRPTIWIWKRNDLP